MIKVIVAVIILNFAISTGVFANERVFKYIQSQQISKDEAQDIYKTVIRYGDLYNVDPQLIVSIIKYESNFKWYAESQKGALGLMQVMPFHFDKSIKNRKDISVNLDVGVKELARCLNKNSGDVVLALAMYNAGEGALRKYGGVPPYKETRLYIDRVLSIYNSGYFNLNRYYAYNSSSESYPVPNKKNTVDWEESDFNVFSKEK